MLTPERKAEIIRLLVAFLLKQGEHRFDVPDLIKASIKNSRVFITGAVGRELPEPLMTALGITQPEELFEALKSVCIDQTIGQSSPFSASFTVPAPEGGK